MLSAGDENVLMHAARTKTGTRTRPPRRRWPRRCRVAWRSRTAPAAGAVKGLRHRKRKASHHIARHQHRNGLREQAAVRTCGVGNSEMLHTSPVRLTLNWRCSVCRPFTRRACRSPGPMLLTARPETENVCSAPPGERSTATMESTKRGSASSSTCARAIHADSDENVVVWQCDARARARAPTSSGRRAHTARCPRTRARPRACTWSRPSTARCPRRTSSWLAPPATRVRKPQTTARCSRARPRTCTATGPWTPARCCSARGAPPRRAAAR